MISVCICGSTKLRDSGIYLDIPIKSCDSCDTIHQFVDKTPAELNAWYSKYFAETYIHNANHDRIVAKKRVTAYGEALTGRVLDFGCGHGSFVDVARAQGVDCVGVDPHSDSCSHSYHAQLRDVHFPVDYFDVVTIHDVLEHLVDPVNTLQEMARIIKSGGTLFLEFPDFFARAGEHHWKPIEHLWILREKQIYNMLSSSGFVVQSVTRPIPGKLLFEAVRKEEKRIKILVPPGIGDIHWVMGKLPGFMKEIGVSVVDVAISTTRADRNRSIDYVRRIPFANAVGYCNSDIRKAGIWEKAYFQDDDCIFPNVLGFDYFIAVNGPLRFDKSLEQDILPQYKMDWHLPMFQSLEEINYQAEAIRQYGDYIVAFFTDHGMYSKWVAKKSANDLFKILKTISISTGCKIILTGANWDKTAINNKLLALDSDHSVFVDLVGKTTLPEYFALLRGAKGCFGFPGGNTIMATVFKIPTIILWHSFYNKRFWETSCPAESLGSWYLPINVASPARAIQNAFIALLENKG